MSETTDAFTFTGRCGHIIRVHDGRQRPHECERPTINLTAGVNDGSGPFVPDGADDAPDESKGASGSKPTASHPAPAVNPCPADMSGVHESDADGQCLNCDEPDTGGVRALPEAARALAAEWKRLSAEQDSPARRTLWEAADDLLALLPGNLCLNCGEVVSERPGAPRHATGPQAEKGTCALSPYGKYHIATEAGL